MCCLLLLKAVNEHIPASPFTSQAKKIAGNGMCFAVSGQGCWKLVLQTHENIRGYLNCSNSATTNAMKMLIVAAESLVLQLSKMTIEAENKEHGAEWWAFCYRKSELLKLTARSSCKRRGPLKASYLHGTECNWSETFCCGSSVILPFQNSNWHSRWRSFRGVASIFARQLRAAELAMLVLRLKWR